MKFLKFLGLALLPAVVFMACQKEYSLEDNIVKATGTLKADGFSGCLPSSVMGVYKVDSVIGLGNRIEIQVDVASTGNYEISTDTVNGFYFNAFGAFTSTGLHTVNMLGHGKPVTEGLTDFVVNFSGSECYLTVNVLSSSALLGSYTLAGTPGICSNASFAGTYTQGVALTSANTLTLEVNVTALGAYTIGAASTNGMIFTAASTFTTLGTQTVQLAGSGTPTSAGNIGITAGNLGGTCTFTIPVLPGTGGVTTWSFTDAATTYSGTTADAILLTAAGIHTLTIPGSNGTGQQLSIVLTDPTNPIGTGTYSGTVITGRFAIFNFLNGAVTFSGSPGTPNNSLSVVLTVFDTVNHRAEGTFSGSVTEGATVHNITSGSFKANMP